jgi:hypothetical protein
MILVVNLRFWQQWLGCFKFYQWSSVYQISFAWPVICYTKDVLHSTKQDFFFVLKILKSMGCFAGDEGDGEYEVVVVAR